MTGRTKDGLVLVVLVDKMAVFVTVMLVGVKCFFDLFRYGLVAFC